MPQRLQAVLQRQNPPFRKSFKPKSLKRHKSISAGKVPHSVNAASRKASKGRSSYRQAKSPIPKKFQAEKPQKAEVHIGRQNPPFRKRCKSESLKRQKFISAGKIPHSEKVSSRKASKGRSSYRQAKSPIPKKFQAEKPQKAQVNIGRLFPKYCYSRFRSVSL